MAQDVQKPKRAPQGGVDQAHAIAAMPISTDQIIQDFQQCETYDIPKQDLSERKREPRGEFHMPLGGPSPLLPRFSMKMWCNGGSQTCTICFTSNRQKEIYSIEQKLFIADKCYRFLADRSPALVRGLLEGQGGLFTLPSQCIRAPAPTLLYGGVCGTCYYLTVWLCGARPPCLSAYIPLVFLAEWMIPAHVCERHPPTKHIAKPPGSRPKPNSLTFTDYFAIFCHYEEWGGISSAIAVWFWAVACWLSQGSAWCKLFTTWKCLICFCHPCNLFRCLWWYRLSNHKVACLPSNFLARNMANSYSSNKGEMLAFFACLCRCFNSLGQQRHAFAMALREHMEPKRLVAENP